MNKGINTSHININTPEGINEFFESGKEITLKLSEKDYNKEYLLKHLDNLVIGQDEAKEALSSAVIDNLNSIRQKKGPLGVFFFAGPTGVGKTHIAQSLAKILLGNEDYITKINCEKFQDSHTVGNLIGAPKGYLGYGESTKLTSDNFYEGYNKASSEDSLNHLVKRFNNFSILVFDEIEKAHPKIKQTLLGILDDGKLEFPTGKEDSVGKKEKIPFDKVTDFSNTIIIFTSNIGTTKSKKNSIGFHSKTEVDKKNIYNKEMENDFSSEFRGRIDKTIVFNELSKDDFKNIIEIELNDYKECASSSYNEQVEITISSKVKKFLLESGFSSEKGAREIKRTIKNKFEKYVDTYFNSNYVFGIIPDNVIIKVLIDIDDKGEFIFKNKAIEKKVSEDKNSNTAIAVLETVSDEGKMSVEKILEGDMPGSMMDIVAECMSLHTMYVKLYSLREEYDLDFDKQMDNILDELRGIYGYSDDDLKILKNNVGLNIIVSKFDFIKTYEGIVFPEDIFPVTGTKNIKKLIFHSLKKHISLNKDFQLERDKSFLVIMEEILEKIMGKKLNKDQVNNYLALTHKCYIELKK